MGIIESIRKRFYYSALHSQPVVSNHRVINMADARSIGILYDSTQPGHDMEIGSYVQRLKDAGKEVEILAYLNDTKQETKGSIPIFNAKGVNWCGVPESERAIGFAKKKFDLLICAVTGENLPLEYLCHISASRYRVGPYRVGKEDCYDLMVAIPPQSALGYLLQQMTDFLNKIKY